MSKGKIWYIEKLKNPKWQKKRLEILDRDDFTCIVCGSDDKTLHVHHKTYQKGKDPWDYPDSNFETLCEHCHEAEHASINEMKDVLDELFRTTNASPGSFIGFIHDIVKYYNHEESFDNLSSAAIGVFTSKEHYELHNSFYNFVVAKGHTEETFRNGADEIINFIKDQTKKIEVK